MPPERGGARGSAPPMPSAGCCVHRAGVLAAADAVVVVGGHLDALRGSPDEVMIRGGQVTRRDQA